jgi:hypothetical protein
LKRNFKSFRGSQEYASLGASGKLFSGLHST